MLSDSKWCSAFLKLVRWKKGWGKWTRERFSMDPLWLNISKLNSGRNLYAQDQMTLTWNDHKIRFSDQTFQLWQKEQGSPLGLVIQRNIQNTDTKNAISQFDTAYHIGNNKSAIWRPGSYEYNALLWTDNGRPIAYLLQDRHQALGNKKVTSIVTLKNSKTFMALNIR